MKTNILKIFLILYACATVLFTTGCNDNKETLTQYEQTIVGKWVQVASALTEDSKEGEYEIITLPDEEEFRYPTVKTFEPNEEYYLEFLSNRKIRYGVKLGIDEEECRDCDCECIFKMDEEYLYVYYDQKIYGTDGDSDTVEKYIFSENNDELKLIYVKGNLEAIFPQYLVKIYKRIN